MARAKKKKKKTTKKSKKKTTKSKKKASKKTKKKKTSKKVTKKKSAKKASKKKAKKKAKKKPAKKAKKKTTKKKAKAKKKPAKKAKKKAAPKKAKKAAKKKTSDKKTLAQKVKSKLTAVKNKLSTKKPEKQEKPAQAPAPKKVEAPKLTKAQIKKKQNTTLLIAEPEEKPPEAYDSFSATDLMEFKKLLNKHKQELLAKARSAIEAGNIEYDPNEMTDEVDMASATIEQNLQFRLLDRDRKLLGEIDHALNKIEAGDFGFCEGTGELIPKRRLELRPWTRHSVKYKEQIERMNKSGRGVGDEDEGNY